MVFVVDRETIGEAHKEAIKTVATHGNMVGNTIELPSPLIIEVLYPTAQPVYYPSVGIPIDALNSYATQLMSGINPGFSYTYGNRLRDYNGIDQIEKAISILRNDHHSRRAIIHTWKVGTDLGSKEIPCVQTLQFFIRNNRLNCVVYIRSNDILLAWGANAYGITRMMEYICCSLNIYIGTLTTISASAHIYRSDVNTLERVLGEL